MIYNVRNVKSDFIFLDKGLTKNLAKAGFFVFSTLNHIWYNAPRMLNATDLKTGTIFKENNQPFVVQKYNHIKTARGGANVKVKAKKVKGIRLNVHNDVIITDANVKIYFGACK